MTGAEKARDSAARTWLGTAQTGHLGQRLSWPAAALLIIAISALLWLIIGAGIAWLIG